MRNRLFPDDISILHRIEASISVRGWPEVQAECVVNYAFPGLSPHLLFGGHRVPHTVSATRQ